MINHLKSKFSYITWYLRVQSGPQRKHFYITEINLLMLFRELVPVCSENRMKLTNTYCRVTDF
jgi:hypothetical protein